jgi:uncharacterized protein YecE (DUF72 family)
MAGSFPDAGTHLARYARVLDCVEINSSFYRSHRAETYRRWAGTTPPQFRFSVKLPRTITHEAQLRNIRALLRQFLDEVGGLGRKLGVLLVQLPPSFAFDARRVSRFLALLRELHPGAAVCEPRHPTWFDGRADHLLERHGIGRVAADPAIVPVAASPAGAPELAYFRLHGTPRMYWSRYEAQHLSRWHRSLAACTAARSVWCIFDNTAGGAATANALDLGALTAQA